MRPLDLRYGTQDMLTLTQIGSTGPRLQQGAEVALRYTPDERLILETDLGPREARPPSAIQRHRLEGLLETNAPRVCTVLAVLGRQPEELVIEVRSFAQGVRLDRPLRLRTDDDPLDYDGLREEFVLPAAAGAGARVIVSSGPDPSDALTTAFQLHGRSRNALVRAGETGLEIYRLVASQHGVDELVTPVALVESPGVELAVEPEAADLDVVLRLRDAVPSRQRYFELWARFLPLEQAQFLEAWDSFGALRYHDVTRRDQDWYFRLEERPTDKQRELLAGKEREVMAVPAGHPPVPGARSSHASDGSAARDDESEEPDGRDELPWPEDGEFAGKARQLDAQAARHLDEHLELRVQTSRLVTPPVAGELRLATRGTRVAWRRRRWAFERMLGGDGPPRLARLLGEMTGKPARRVAGRPLDEREIRKAFGASGPTKGQSEAIEVAVRTPDIAIIHGPPGTGKTRVIHAVSTQLADKAPPQAAGEPPALLLTSHAREAVRNVAEQTEVFDMPAATVGLPEDRAMQMRSAREWAQTRLRQLEESGSAATEAHHILYELHRQVNAYELAPASAGETAQILLRILRECDAHLGPGTVSALRAKADELSEMAAAPATGPAQPYEAALRAVRGIRAVAAAWDDDGPERAEAAVLALRTVDLIAPPEEALLRQATVDDLDSVSRLKDELIDRLVERIEAPLRPRVDEHVRALLSRAAQEARDRVLSRPDGVPLVIAEYRDALRHDLPQVERLKRDYASLIATTCQRAQDSRLLSPKGERPRFETVIVDEAARASPLDLLIPLCGATRRVILVGDHRQLPHIMERELEDRLKSQGGDDYADLLHRSLFEHVRRSAEKQHSLDGVPRIALLDQQFRMHPRLGSLVNEVFYEPHGERVGNGDREAPRHRIPDFEGRVAAWLDVPLSEGTHQRRGTSSYRQAEAEVVADRVARLHAEHPGLSIGVIAFYRAQRDEILTQLVKPRHALAVEGDWGVELLPSAKGKLLIGTVDAFQGREFDVVLLSVTRSNGASARPHDESSWWRKWGHLRFPNRMCVALSRQRALLIAVGDRKMATDPVAEHAVPGLWRFERLCREEEAAALD